MTKPTVYWASVALLALVTIGSSSAQAKYVVRFEEVGQNVVETGSGALDVTDLTNLGGSITHKPAVVPNDPFFSSGAIGAELQVFVGDLTGPDDFGAGPETFADQSSGDGVGVFKSDSFSLLLPLGYTSGSPLSDTSTYLFETLASLGARPGEYVWSWGSGADADTFTVEIGGVFPSPSPSLRPGRCCCLASPDSAMPASSAAADCARSPDRRAGLSPDPFSAFNRCGHDICR
jgi:hypothetical protein